MSANTAEQYSTAVQQTREMARALALTVSACRKQNIAQKLLKRKLVESTQTVAKISKDRDVSYAQVCSAPHLEQNCIRGDFSLMPSFWH